MQEQNDEHFRYRYTDRSWILILLLRRATRRRESDIKRLVTSWNDQRSAISGGWIGSRTRRQRIRETTACTERRQLATGRKEGKQGKLNARDFGRLVALSVHSAVRTLRSPYNTRMTTKLLCNALATHRSHLAHTPVHRIVVPSSTSSVSTTSRLRQDRASMTTERHHVSLRRGSLVARVPTHDQTHPPRRPSNSAHHRNTRTRVYPT